MRKRMSYYYLSGISPCPWDLLVIGYYVPKKHANTHRSGDADLIASDDDDLLAGEELLGHDRGQAAQEVIASVDYNGFGHGCWLGGFD